jgi:hypothetical protein
MHQTKIKIEEITWIFFLSLLLNAAGTIGTTYTVCLVNVGQLVECKSAWEAKVLGENLPHCHLAYHKSHMT